jgi:hypothetical protein
MIKLAENLVASRGLYCGHEGLYLGPSPLIERDFKGGYRLRPEQEIAALLAAAYDPAPDSASLLAGMRAVAAHLEVGDLSRAMISAVLLGLTELSAAALARLACAEELLKYNFNPAEPRDEGGRWTHDEAAGLITPVRSTGPSRGGTDSGRDWMRYPNAEFRNRLAIAELSAGKPDFGYREVRRSNNALGRYQMTRAGLLAAGMIDGDGDWTGKYGVHSSAQFLADHDAQEKALTDFLRETERQLHTNGAFDYIGRTINGIVAPFTVTHAGLIAAAHEEGAGATYSYQEKIRDNGFTSRGLSLNHDQRAVEHRLRIFADAPYE